MMPKLDLAKITPQSGSSYPAPYAAEMGDRAWLPLGQVADLTQFGVNLMMMQPGSKSSLRHWHSHEDEFLMMVSGELILVDDAGEHVLKPGDCAAFKAGDTNAHQVVNRSGSEARFLVAGTSLVEDVCTYPDVDMSVRLVNGKNLFTRGNGTEVM